MNARKSALQPTGYTIDAFGRAIAVFYRASGMAFCLDLCSLAGALGVFPNELEEAVGRNGLPGPEHVHAGALKYAIAKLIGAHPELDGAALMRFALGLRARSFFGGNHLHQQAFVRAGTLSPQLADAYAMLYQTTSQERRLLLAKPDQPYLDIEVVAQSIYHQWLADEGVQRWLLNSFRDTPDPLPELPAVKYTWTH